MTADPAEVCTKQFTRLAFTVLDAGSDIHDYEPKRINFVNLNPVKVILMS